MTETAAAIALSYADCVQQEDEYAELREQLYHDEGPGFVHLRQFLDQETAQEIAQFWVTHDPATTHEKFLSRQCLHIRCPDYFQGPTATGHKQYYNFYWNKPAHPLTMSIAHQIELLRSRIEQRQNCHELYPAPAESVIAGQYASYRISINREGKRIVPTHRDWTRFPTADPRRLQATLLLSEKGRDYTGIGLTLSTNQGQQLVVGEDFAALPGDLLLWRYCNAHSVSDIHTTDEQLGFARMTQPNVSIYGPRSRRREFYWQVKTGHRLRTPTRFLLNYVRPLYRKFRGLSAHPDESNKNMKYDNLDFPYW